MLPVGDKAGGERCLRGDLCSVADGIRFALEDISRTNPESSRDALEDILDTATRHAGASGS